MNIGASVVKWIRIHVLRHSFEVLIVIRYLLILNRETYKLLLNASCWDSLLEIQLFRVIIQKRHMFGFLFFPLPFYS